MPLSSCSPISTSSSVTERLLLQTRSPLAGSRSELVQIRSMRCGLRDSRNSASTAVSQSQPEPGAEQSLLNALASLPSPPSSVLSVTRSRFERTFSNTNGSPAPLSSKMPVSVRRPLSGSKRSRSAIETGSLMTPSAEPVIATVPSVCGSAPISGDSPGRKTVRGFSGSISCASVSLGSGSMPRSCNSSNTTSTPAWSMMLGSWNFWVSSVSPVTSSGRCSGQSSW